jgi:transglutaminase-like putative cysteine protease
MLLERQVQLNARTRPSLYGSAPLPPTRVSRPRLEAVSGDVAPEGTQPGARLVALTRWTHRIPLDFPQPERSTVRGFHGDFGAYSWGGSEEAIIAKGSPWPQELARVLIALLHQAGLPARMVFLYRAAPPALHAVVEAWVNGTWAVCDPCANRCYVWPHHGYASAADLQAQPKLVDQQPEHGHNPYVDSAFYETVAISDYAVAAPDDGAYVLEPVTALQAGLLRDASRVFAE